MGWSGGTDDLDAEVREAYQRVPWIERTTSGWLILRGLNRNPRRARELERYGPRGAVNLARMRAMQGWGYILSLPIVAAAIVFGPPNVLWALLVVFVLSLTAVIVGLRLARQGKRWRSEHHID